VLLRTLIAVQLAEQSTAVLLGPVGVVGDKGFDLLARCFAQSLRTAEVDRIRSTSSASSLCCRMSTTVLRTLIGPSVSLPRGPRRTRPRSRTSHREACSNLPFVLLSILIRLVRAGPGNRTSRGTFTGAKYHAGCYRRFGVIVSRASAFRIKGIYTESCKQTASFVELTVHAARRNFKHRVVGSYDQPSTKIRSVSGQTPL